MGKKKVKAVCIVRGSQGAARGRRARRSSRPPTRSPMNCKTDPSTRSLYEYGTLPGVVNLLGWARCPSRITPPTSPEGADMSLWEAPGAAQRLRSSRPPVQRLRHAPLPYAGHPHGAHKGKIVDEPEYEGWSGAGWAIGADRPGGVSWLNTQIDRAGVDVNEFGWLIGWVMECLEKGYITKEQLAAWKCAGATRRPPTSCCK